MYKEEKGKQLTFDGFNQLCGCKLDPNDEWVVRANVINWSAVEAEYRALFPAKRGRHVTSARIALGALIIQNVCALATANSSGKSHATSRPAILPRTPGVPADVPITGNLGTTILDATCSLSNISYPQDFSLLNEVREKLDAMIDKQQKAKSKKRTYKQNRAIVYSMLNAVKREPWIC